MKRALGVVSWVVLALGVALGVALLVSEVRWARLNDPRGKFATADEYLAAGRPPEKVYRIADDGGAFFVAYGPLTDLWLAVPSGPPAYVFDDRGALVDWSSDTGDNPSFLDRWQRESQTEVPLDALRDLPVAAPSASSLQQEVK